MAIWDNDAGRKAGVLRSMPSPGLGRICLSAKIAGKVGKNCRADMGFLALDVVSTA